MKRALLSLAYTTGGRKGAVDERLNVAQIYIRRAPSGGSKNFNLREFTYDCLKILNGFIHFIANTAKEAILEPVLISTLFPPKQSPRSCPYGVPIILTNITTARCIHNPSPSLPGILI